MHQPRAQALARAVNTRRLQFVCAGALLLGGLITTPTRAALSIGNNPLYLVAAKANVLMVLDNSNSMDEAPNGAAAGSFSSDSKSEIARGVIRSMTDTYRSRVNMGLMSYRLNTPSSYYVHTSPYDASFDPATYDPAWTGSRASATHKRYRITARSTAEGRATVLVQSQFAAP